MSLLDMVIAALPETQLTLAGLLRSLHRQGRLEPLVREALAAQVVQQQARQAGLAATAEELQAAADFFRRTHGLHGAADTRAWLTARGLSEDDFEAVLEQEILTVKLRSHLTAAEVDGRFAAEPAGFERLRLALLLVGRDDLARELASQVRDDGRDLEGVAREHALAVVHRQLFRKQLDGSLAQALASAKTGELVGPVGTPQGFVLLVIEERQPAELDAETQQSIQNELFTTWLADRMKEATFDLTMLETAG
jgi:hypothetical protein